MTGGSRKTRPKRATDGGHGVYFEEELHIKDEEGASRMIPLTKKLFAFMVGFTIFSFFLVAGTAVTLFAPAFGGIDGMWAAVRGIYAEQPGVIGGALLTVLFLVLYFLVAIVGSVRGMRQTFDEQVTVRVTDSGLSVRQEGGRAQSKWMITPYDPTGVDVPFDTITAVEYADQERSSLRLELGDWRAPKYFAGRGQDWVRIERTDGPAVYVGSDRKIELADTLAQHSPHLERAEPF